MKLKIFTWINIFLLSFLMFYYIRYVSFSQIFLKPLVFITFLIICLCIIKREMSTQYYSKNQFLGYISGILNFLILTIMSSFPQKIIFMGYIVMLTILSFSLKRKPIKKDLKKYQKSRYFQ